jgi:nitrilase
VIGCCIAMTRNQIPDRYGFKSLYPPAPKPEDVWVNVGNSVIVAPYGSILAGPVLCEEKIIYTEIDRDSMRQAKFTMDQAGHYARPDVFQLTVNRDPNAMINVTGASPVINSHQAPVPARKRRAGA